MKIAQAIDYHLHYHHTNSKKNTIKTCQYVLFNYNSRFGRGI